MVLNIILSNVHLHKLLSKKRFLPIWLSCTLYCLVLIPKKRAIKVGTIKERYDWLGYTIITHWLLHFSSVA